MATLPSPGDVVIMLHHGIRESKLRPFVVISSDTYHATRPDVIVAVMTSHIPPSPGPTDYVLVDWKIAGLRYPTMFRGFLNTVPIFEVPQPIGRLSPSDWAEVQARLRLAIAV